MEPRKVTNEQIARLGVEAAEHGDIHMSAICAKAIGEDYSAHALTPAERAKVDAMTAAAARAECERVIRDARGYAE